MAGHLELKHLLALPFIAVIAASSYGALPWWAPFATFGLVGAGQITAFGVRRAAGRNLRLTLERGELRRGERLGVRLAIADVDQAGEQIEVGLVCEVSYTVPGRDSEGEICRDPNEAIAYERWSPMAAGSPSQSFEFDVPRDAPFTHDGFELMFEWKVVARDVRERGLDPTASAPITVLP